jgi:hypothetical protein
LTKVANVDLLKVIIGECWLGFEVMTQIDHDLTTVNKFDQHLGLIKNLGRHSLPALNGISSRDSTLKKKVGRYKLVVFRL